MKKETKSWLSTFLAGFLATVLGIGLTFGVQSLINSNKKARTAKLLAKQIVEDMDRTCTEIKDYLEIYNSLDSASICLTFAMLADTLERVDTSVVVKFLENSVAEYVQIEVDDALDSYLPEILYTIGNVELIAYIDEFYCIARQCVKVSQQVIDQKRVVSDVIYSHTYRNGPIVDNLDFVRYLFDLPEYNLFFMRMQSARPPLMEGVQLMEDEIASCKAILNVE